MKLQHQTEVSATPQDVWDFLQDTRAVVQCLPGAELVEELVDDRYRGILRVAIGPLKMNYAGDVSVLQRNAEDREIVLDATGRDKRGSGAVRAHVRLQVAGTERGALIVIMSDLELTGRIASLGRGVRDVSNRMFVQFAAQLANLVENPAGVVVGAGTAQEDAAAAGAPTSGVVSDAALLSQDRPVRPASPASSGEIKVLPLVWAVTRERLADLLDRLSKRVRPL